MALFGRKKEETATDAPLKKDTTSAAPKKKKKGGKLLSGASKGTAHPLVLRSPRITEKATDLTGNDVYTFNIAVNATKKEVAKAIENVYGVTPRKVNVLPVRGKKVSGRRGLGGKTARGKKAYVFLKKGDSLDVV